MHLAPPPTDPHWGPCVGGGAGGPGLAIFCVRFYTDYCNKFVSFFSFKLYENAQLKEECYRLLCVIVR